MDLATSSPTKLDAARRPPVFGPRVWGWGVAGGLALWALGIVLLPWWAALLLWWWPSLLFGAAVGFFAIALAKQITRWVEARAARRKPGSS